MCFLLNAILWMTSAWISLWMWKQQQFGLGFQAMTGNDRIGKPVNLKQQVMLGVYITNIVLAWVLCSILSFIGYDQPKLTTDTMPHDHHEESTMQRIMSNILWIVVYHGVLLLASAIHETPDRHPYDYLLWTLRFVGLFGLATHSWELNLFIHQYT